MEKLMSNYTTTNKMDDACQKDWCVSPVPSKVQQVNLRLNNGRSYDYLCRYSANPEAIAIVGWTFPELTGDHVEKSANTGAMGQVCEISPTITIKRSRAVEIDYVINVNPVKKNLTQCVKYLNMDGSSYRKTMQLDKELTPIRPISYHIRRILAAASIIAHPKFVTEDDITLAKSVIAELKFIDAKMTGLTAVIPEDIGIALSDIHVPDDSVINVFERILNELNQNSNWRPAKGELHGMSNIVGKFARLETVSAFVNKYAHFGAISIMVRGGFANLLEAYLSANPPIEEYRAEMRKILDGVGYREAYDIL